MNPYQMVGRPARNERFVGRGDLVARVRSTVEVGRPANMSIVGNHRTGKTSLVYRAIVDGEQLRTDLMTVFVDAGSVATPLELFKRLCWELGRRLGTVLEDPTTLISLAERVSAEETWYGLSSALMDLFEAVRDEGIFVLLVIDEFDRLAMPEMQVAHFQLLRDICSGNWSSAGLITVSRQHVRIIEIGAAGGSCLDQVLAIRTYVSLMVAEERAEVVDRARVHGRPLGDQIALIDRIAGLHPYLIELVCYELYELDLREDREEGEPGLDSLRRSCSDFFARLLAILDSDLGGTGIDKLYQIIDGVGLTVSLEDAQEVLRNGLVVVDPDGRLVPFSTTFNEYLRAAANERDFRGTWVDCEVGLRRVIRRVLVGASGLIGEIPPNLAPIYDRAEGRRQKDQPLSEYALDALDYMYPDDLFQIITQRWDAFGPVLGGTRRQWQAYGESVSAARNAAMHLRPIPGHVALPARAATSAIVAALRVAEEATSSGEP